MGLEVGLSVGEKVGAGVLHTPLGMVQSPLMQSLPTLHFKPGAHGGQLEALPPPQSISVSAEPFILSVHVAPVGAKVGSDVGCTVGFGVGEAVGEAVGLSVGA